MRWLRRAWPMLALGMLACTADLPWSGDEAEEDAGEETGLVDPLAGDPFHFCHRPDADEVVYEEWCEMLKEAPPDRCPGLREICEQEPVEEQMDFRGGCLGGGGVPRISGTPTAPGQGPDPRTVPLGCDCTNDLDLSWAELLAQVVKWVAAMLVALMVVGLAGAILRLVLHYRGDQALEEAVKESTPPVIVLEDPEDIPEVPSGDLLNAARRALAEERLGDAVLLARAAALRRLGEAGRIRIHRAKTDREYVRAVKREPELQQPLRKVVRAVEFLRWGGRGVQRETAEGVLSAAEKLIQSVALVSLLILGGGAFSDSAQASSYGPDGSAALLPLFEGWGFEASWRLRSIRSLDDETQVLVLDSDEVLMSEDDWRSVRGWVESGGLLIVAGSAEQGFPELGTRVATMDRREAALWGALREEGVAAPVWPRGPRFGWWQPRGDWWVSVQPKPGSPETFVGPEFVPELDLQIPEEEPSEEDESGDDGEAEEPVAEVAVVPPEAYTEPLAIVQALSLGTGGVVAIADTRLLHNGALVAPRNGAFLGACLYAGQGMGLWEVPPNAKLELATVGGGETSPTPASSLANARLLPFVIQLLVILGLAALWLGWPFGPLRDPPGEGRQAFVEHIEALGVRYARLGASRHAAHQVADLWLQRLGAQGLRDAAVRAGHSPERASELVAQVTDLAEHPDGPDHPRDMTLMEELWKITRHS